MNYDNEEMSMPTYRNTTNQNIRIKGRGNEDFVAPLKTLETHVYYDIDGLELVTDDPVYTPLINEITLQGTLDAEMTVSVDAECEFMLFDVSTGIVELHNVSIGNKIKTLNAGNVFGWDVKRRSRQIICVFTEAGSVQVSQYREKCEIA